MIQDTYEVLTSYIKSEKKIARKLFCGTRFFSRLWFFTPNGECFDCFPTDGQPIERYPRSSLRHTRAKQRGVFETIWHLYWSSKYHHSVNSADMVKQSFRIIMTLRSVWDERADKQRKYPEYEKLTLHMLTSLTRIFLAKEAHNR